MKLERKGADGKIYKYTLAEAVEAVCDGTGGEQGVLEDIQGTVCKTTWFVGTLLAKLYERNLLTRADILQLLSEKDFK